MRLRLAAGLICLEVLALPLRLAHGMQFQPIPVSSTEVVLDGRGAIVPGDADRLMRALAGVPRTGRTLLALALDSGGGNVAEAKQMVSVIRSRQLPVVIPRNSQCASACFLMLAASPHRFAATDALVGVDSASQNGAETDTSLAVTTLMARDAAELGIPPLIIGKMVQTTPGRVEWLDLSDLALMQVTTFDGDALTALHQTPPPRVQGVLPPSASLPSIQTGSGQAAATSTPPTYTAGRDDRGTWDAWIGGLRRRPHPVHE